MRTFFNWEESNGWLGRRIMHAISWDMLVNLQYSEKSQEHWNKYITRFKGGSGACARQHGVSVNMVDISGRMLMMTHPSIASQKRQIICGKCQQAGHSPKSKAYHCYGPANEEEARINKYFTH